MPLPKDPIKREKTLKKMSEVRKGHAVSEETRRKISESEKGKKVSEETRRKLSEINKGKKQPPEVTEKIRAANTGKKRSPEFCKHLSEISRGRKPSLESRIKMSEAQKGKKQSQDSIEKRVAKIIGRQRSLRTKKKCAYCGKELILAEWEKNRKFCSVECKGKWQSENAIGEKGAHWKGGDVIKKCDECGKEFSVEKNRIEKARFCSQRCKGIWLAKHEKIQPPPIRTGANHPRWKGGDLIKKCEVCGKGFFVERIREDSARFCSTTCAGIWRSKNLVGEKNPTWRRITKTCIECGKVIIVKNKDKDRAKFCSRSCQRKWMAKNLVGANNPNWTGGPKEYCEKWTLEFRRRIRAFFDYKCGECGTPQNDTLLHCHHVYYDKKACCSVNENGKYYSNLGIKGNPFTFEIIGEPNKFIALCDRCHKSTSGKKNREYWARHFEEIINNYYLGKSYFTKEEYEK